MALKSYKELMELQGASGTTGSTAQTSNQMLDLILNRQPHSYDPATDPAAQAARKTAARNARTVTQDTMGRYAGMTGGMPSTAAVSAAAQAGNQAVAQGADKVAELEQLSYQNYLQEGQNMMNAYTMMQGQEQDAWNRQMQEQQIAYQKEQDEYQKKLAMAKLAASYGDLSGLKELGIDTSKYTTGGSTARVATPDAGDTGDGDGIGDGLPAAVKNELVMLAYDNGGYIPAGQWASYAAQYGEAALIAAGFRKAQANNNQTTENRTPNTRHPGIAKGESELGTRD